MILAIFWHFENFYKKSGHAIFYPFCPPNSSRVSEKSLELFPRSIRYGHTDGHTDNGDIIEPVAFAGSISSWALLPTPVLKSQKNIWVDVQEPNNIQIFPHRSLSSSFLFLFAWLSTIFLRRSSSASFWRTILLV